MICRGQPVVNYNSKSLDRVDTRNAMPPRMTKACQLTKIVFPVGLAVPGGLKLGSPVFLVIIFCLQTDIVTQLSYILLVGLG